MTNSALKRFAAAWWYRIAFGATIVTPAFLCQTVAPIVPMDFWERRSEDLYALLGRLEAPASGSSRVVVIEVDDKTIQTYGWPVNRQAYIDALSRLADSGRPWVLSMLQFQSLAQTPPNKTNTNKTDQHSEDAEDTDARLATAIKDYQRYVGTGLQQQAGASLDADQEDHLLPRVLLSTKGMTVDDLPANQGLRIVEDTRFVEGQGAFGFGSRFGTEPVVHCMSMFITDPAQTGAILLPSAFAWVAALASDARLSTSPGATWPRPGEPQPYKQTLEIAHRHCDGAPGVLTRDYYTQRRIDRISLVDFIERERPYDLDGSVVVLAGADMRRYRGPGVARDGDDGIVSEHLLAARLLDGILAGTSIQRNPLQLNATLAWLPLAAAATLALFSLLLPTSGVIAAGVLLLSGLLGLGAYSLSVGQYLVPIQAAASIGLSVLAVSLLGGYLRYYGVRRQIRFSRYATNAFSQCNSLAEIEARTAELCQGEFGQAHTVFDCVDRELYQASSNPAAALARLSQRPKGVPAFVEGGATGLTRSPRPLGFVRVPFRATGLEARLAIDDAEFGRLGVVSVGISFAPHEETFVAEILETLRVQLSQHWHRIRRLVDQKMLDYKFLAEQTRGDIMKRFLTQSLVSRFSDARTMEENLRLVLTPRPTKAALMQADIRGYSKLSARLKPEDMVRILQGYFREVVNAATQVAQVKLIGDCIFLFIEEDAAGDGLTPADLALDLACILVQETLKQNVLRAAENIESLNFGIAIHYGEVVVGNLSSDLCIDYTVIGPNVNLVARLEEMTKNPAILERVGLNGLLLSPQAYGALQKHRGLIAAPIDLAAAGVSVRSFAEVQTVHGVTAAELLGRASPWQAAG